MAKRKDLEENRLSRREFLGRTGRTIGVAAALPALSMPLLASATGGKSKVVLVRHSKVIDPSGKVQAPLVSKMLTRAMVTLTGKTNIQQAWSSFIGNGRPIGIKINTLGLSDIAGTPMIDHFSAVAFALVDQLKAAGVAEKELIVWDRSDEELTAAGLSVQKEPGKLRVTGFKKSRRGDAAPALFHPKEYPVGDMRVRLCRLLTDDCQTLINVPLLKHHRATGLTGALKSHYGSIDDPRQFHSNSYVEQGVPEVNAIGLIREKQRLVVADCLLGLYEGGPWWDASRTWPFGGILVGTDPVAVDTVLSGLLDEQRRAKHLKPVTPSNRQLGLSEKLGLGVGSPARIDLKKIELS